METTCAYCGKTLERYPSRVKMYKDQFCDSNCHDLYRSRRVEIVCETCGKPFAVKASVARKGRRFCSKACTREIQSMHQIRRYRSAARRVAECGYCGKVFERKPSQLEKYKNNFCSRECSRLFKVGRYPEHQVTGNWYPCYTCGTPVWRTPATLRPHVFCSRGCTHKMQGSIQAPRNGADNPMWKGGVSSLPYTPGFNKAVKEFIKDRDGHRCRLCKRSFPSAKLHVHHIDESKDNHRPGNLLTLCASCHRKVHHRTVHLPVASALV